VNIDRHASDNEWVKSKTKAFIARHFTTYDLKDDEDIFSLGFVNSLFALQLVMFVEKEFRIKVEDEDLQIENFRTVNALVDLVRRKHNP
jgi:methoxymalonate biosynthesis acyl carrier protein